jgi:Flp pilus assembly protein TadG
MPHRIRDISLAGLYLLTEQRWYPGTVVRLVLQRGGAAETDPHRSITVNAKVVRSGSDGVGLALVLPHNQVSRPKQKLDPTQVNTMTFSRFLQRPLEVEFEGKCPSEQQPNETNLPVPQETGSEQGVEISTPTPHWGRVMRRLKDESGQVLVLTVLSMSLLIGFLALAVDVGTLFRAKRLMQTAADSAAIAGAQEYPYGDWNAAAVAAAAQNGVVVANGDVVTVNPKPLSGPFIGQNGYVEVIVSQRQPTFFAKIFTGSMFRNSVAVTARAVATLGQNQNCVYTLGATGQDVSVTGNAAISIAKCGIVDDSSSSNALSITGNATLDAKMIGIVGGYSKTGNVTLTPTPAVGIGSTSDPLSFLPIPVPSGCSADPQLTGNITKTLTQGCYNGITATGNITLNLSPGLYVINGNLNLTGNITLTGTGVTLDLLGSTSLPGNISLDLSAPTSGTYNGVLIIQPSTNTNPLSLVGNAGSIFEGIVYAPDAAVDITGNSGSSIYAAFVVKSLSLVGNVSLQDYASINGSSVLTAARLVE